MALKPNLERARRKIESLMADVCIIARDVQEYTDDVLDEDTGLLVEPPNDSSGVYNGPCLVLPSGVGREEGAQGQPVELLAKRAYRGLIPRDVTDIEVHDQFKVTASQRDPDLVDRVFIVRGIKSSTFAIFRELDLEGDR